MRIYDLMSRAVVSVRPETPLKEVARLMVEHAISGIPVVDERSVVVGVISESDFMIKERGREHISRSPLRWLLGEGRHDLDRVEATAAGQAMTSPPITIAGQTTSLREAAMMMAEHKVNRLPVTEAGKLVGIITRGDLLRVYTQTDEAIQAAAEEVLRETEGISVTAVSDGVVTLTSEGADRDVAAAALRVVEGIDGVMAVELSSGGVRRHGRR